MNLYYTPDAIADLDSIHDFVAADSSAAAERVTARILQALAILESFPLIGREGRVLETRELSINGLPFIGVYRIATETDIEVISIVHTSRQYPPLDG